MSLDLGKIKLGSTLASAILVIITIYLHLFFFSTYLTLFLIVFIFERLFESFFTSSSSEKPVTVRDWPLSIVVATYVIYILFSILELYLLKQQNPKLISLLTGGFLLFLSFVLRIKTIKALGNDWSPSTYSIPSKLRTNSVFRINRNPYYTGVLLEVLALGLILNTWLSLIFGLIIFIPCEAIRGIKEEKILADEFGEEYFSYKQKVNRFLPSRK